jgi:hypothetical protein
VEIRIGMHKSKTKLEQILMLQEKTQEFLEIERSRFNRRKKQQAKRRQENNKRQQETENG